MKFVREPWCRTKFLPWPVSLHFPKAGRNGWTDRQRADELSRWTDLLARPNAMQHVLREVLRTFGDTLLLPGAATALTIERDALLNSTSWRLTAPLRAAVEMVQRLRSRQDA